MKYMATWSAKPGALREAVSRFLAGEGAPGEGVTLSGRWHSVDLSIGFTLYEAADPAALYRSTARWADLLDIRMYPVIEDSDAGPALASVLAK